MPPLRPRNMCPLINMIRLMPLLLLSHQVACTTTQESKREQILRAEQQLSVGGRITLTTQEIKVNNCLMQLKLQEIDEAFLNPQYFNFSHHFFKYRDNIPKSKVYKIIKDLPKGAALHLHDVGILGPDYLMNITYMSQLYVCFVEDKVQFRFSDQVPGEPNLPCTGLWTLMSDARKASKNVRKFDADLRKRFTMIVNDPALAYPSIKESWKAFMNYFETVIPLVSFRPVWEQYFYDVLKAFRDDNIMYVEVRSLLPKLYELDGTIYDQVITAKAYKKSINKFMKDYPDFIGAKLIFAPSRNADIAILKQYLELAGRVKAEVADTFAGFDLVGQEDVGRPLIEFVPYLTADTNNLTYFFHAGETDWYGTSTDENLVDAILLNPKRIGHAYALPKHPLLVKEVLERDIGLEVNVISNTVLSLVQDVRNHPLALFLAQGLPVVISSDDPGAWEADPISDDFYVAFAGVASRWADLKMLKQLAINSLIYSSLQGDPKVQAFKKFYAKWDDFINNFNCSSYDTR